MEVSMKDLKKLAEQYKDELLDNVLPFWLNKSQDKEYGGYYTCLLRNGDVFDTDKFIWLQGREVWMFAMLYNSLDRKQASIPLNDDGSLKEIPLYNNQYYAGLSLMQHIGQTIRSAFENDTDP